MHYLRNLLTKVPKSAQPWVATLVRTVFDQPAAEEVHAQHARVVDSLEVKHPDAAAHLDEARGDLLAFTGPDPHHCRSHTADEVIGTHTVEYETAYYRSISTPAPTGAR